MEEKFSITRSEIQVTKKNKDLGESNTVKNINDGVTQLQSMIAEERKNREEGYEVLIKRLGDEILRLNESLSTEN